MWWGEGSGCSKDEEELNGNYEEEEDDPVCGKEEKLDRISEEEGPGGDKESSFIVELKINIILGDVSWTINKVAS